MNLELTLGVEEEFFLIDPETRDLLADPDERIFEHCERNGGRHRFVRELLRSQLEANTCVCNSVAEVRAALVETRRTVIEAAERHGARAMAASSHPLASWREQVHTDRDRYARFAMLLQDAVRRCVVGGMHVHAGFGTEDQRIRVMTALRRHLPLLHALSTSSPFSGGHETGYKSWRLSIVGGLPRTGIPRPLRTRAAYERLVDRYRRMDFIKDGSELWWDIRPAAVHPTIEVRIFDICTTVDDAMGVIALLACLARRSLRREQAGRLSPEPPTELMLEDRWLAQRYGVHAFFGSPSGTRGREDIEDLAVRLVEELRDDAEALGCETELRHVLTIIRNGTSADRQLDLYRLRILEGDSREQALIRVIDQIVAETRESARNYLNRAADSPGIRCSPAPQLAAAVPTRTVTMSIPW